jgi:hypothetical protein
MSLSPNDLAGPTGDSFKFEQIGDTVEGTIVYVGAPYERTNKFNNNLERVIRVGIDTGNGECTYIWPVVGSPMAQAIAQAAREAKVNLAEGHRIKVGYTSNKDTGKGNPMKVFSARITPGVAAAEEESPF